MKTDRLYAVTLYLLNHGRTSASELAKHFEVSVRTIQRDIDALCCCGIPVMAINGSKGGYEIADSFQMSNQLMSEDDFSYILTALNGLKTVTGNPQIQAVYEKVASLSKRDKTGMVLDFSVLREGDEKLLLMLQTAVLNKKAVCFTYTNNNGETRSHTVEPIAVIYRWYAWYLLAYSRKKQDYRTYKLVRMENTEITEQDFTREHPGTNEILAENTKNEKENTKMTTVKVRCAVDTVYRVKEYLNGKILQFLENKSVMMEFHVVEKEQWWIGIVMSLGDKIQILEPEHIKRRVFDLADKIVSLY